MMDIFFVTPPGLEAVTIREISQLNQSYEIKFKNINQQALEISTDLGGLYLYNLMLRTPNRILIRGGKFIAKNFATLVEKSATIPWENFIKADTKIKIRTTCKKSRLYHSDAVSERVILGVQKRLGFTPNVQTSKTDDTETNEQLIIVRLNFDQCTISIDSSGLALHQRGYRTHTHKAPIRENLAAAMLLSMNWTGHSPLIDPFCGSGTIPIEAAMIAKNIPPGINRDFQFRTWKNYNPNLFEELKNKTKNNIIPLHTTIIGSDRNLGAINMSQNNAKNILNEGEIQWIEQAFSNLQFPHQPGLIITNPPYGLRINSNQDIRNLYAKFGNLLKERGQGWEVLFLCNQHKLATQTRLNLSKKLSFTNGGIPVGAYYSKVE